MDRMVFINLPVTDLARSRAFYEGLGYTINPNFSDEETACVVVSPTIYFMLLTHAKFAGFSPRPIADASAATGALIALNAETRAAADAMADAAIAHGGKDNDLTQDHGFMYSRSVSDPDGHVLELFWMDPAAAGG